MLVLGVLVLGASAAVQGLRAWSQARLGPQVAKLARPGDIFMIASQTCTYCAKARTWFEANQIPFGECLIERDAYCAAQYNALLAPGTPVLLVRGQRVLGFNPQAVADALADTPAPS